MIAYWMLYCLSVGALLTLGALAMERGMRAARLPQRWVWAAAMVLGLALPAAARWMPNAPEPVHAAPATMRMQPPATPVPSSDARPAERVPAIDVAALDRPLAIGWMMLSGTAAIALLGAALILARRRRGWMAAEVEGVPVLLSAETGPAVVGLIRGRIVLPAWVLDADPAERALLMEHEREHLRAGDPRLLALGLLSVAVMPWNPFAWIQMRRLRLAIEIDCDARVLARRADVRAYGTLLLNVGRRASSSAGLIAAAAFSEPTSFLERRIRIMTAPHARRSLLRAAGFGAVAVALVAAACGAPEPARPVQPAAPAADPVSLEIQPREAVARLYPQVARGLGDSVTVVLSYSPDGKLADHRMTVRGQPRTGPLPAFAQIPSRLDMTRFRAGELGPDPVTVFTMRQLTPEEAAASAGNPTDTVITSTVPTATRVSVQTDTVTIPTVPAAKIPPVTVRTTLPRTVVPAPTTITVVPTTAVTTSPTTVPPTSAVTTAPTAATRPTTITVAPTVAAPAPTAVTTAPTRAQ